MQFSTVVLLLLAGSAAVEAADPHPIGKVVTLLQDLMEKVKSEGQAEEVSFQKFVYWCKTSTTELSDAIAEEKETIDTLESTIEGKTKEIELFKEDIKKLEDEIKDLQAADKAAIDDNKERNDLYLEKKTDIEDTIKAIGEAVTALEAAAKSTDSKLLLAQHKLAQDRVRNIFALIATVATEGEQDSLLGFVQDTNSTVPKGVMAAGDNMKHVKKYSFKSNKVTELLKTLSMKFEDDLVTATRHETAASNSFALSKSARDATLKAAEDSKKQKESDLGDAEGTLKAAEGDLKDEQDDLTADSGALDTTTDSCNMKKTEWEERSTIRSQELEAMAAGVKILAKVSGVRTEAPSNPVPPAAPVALAQVMSLLQISSEPQQRAVQLLRSTAKTYKSKALERLAAQIASHVPAQFQDVINSIQKMIFRLKQEQTDEDNHKAWCDAELSKTNSSLDDKDDKIKELNAKLKEDNAKVVTLTTDIEAAQKMLNDINAFQKEATEIRNTGKDENSLAIKDAVDAQRAITNAISVLTSFYKSTGSIKKEPWEFLQDPVELPKNPSTWDSGYSGVADPKKAGEGVIAVLEACSSDFSKMEANTRAQEAADSKEYDEAMKKHSIELARRSKESEMKGAEKKRLLDRIVELNKNKKHVSNEVESTEQYYHDLMPACIDGDSTYEDRKAARAAEIGALAKAQGILDTAFSAQAATAAPTTTAKGAMFLHKIGNHW
jgi:peptidoglycan hydrolase CwlO-like protein